MRYSELNEMPIADFRKIGNHDNTDPNFQPADDALLSSPKGIAKIKDAFAKTKYDFNIYVVMSEARKQHGLHAIGISASRETLETVLGQPIDTEGKITVFYFNNVTGRYPRPFNAWTFAHRFGHALQGRFKGNGEDMKVFMPLFDLYTAVHGTKIEITPDFFGTRFGRQVDTDKVLDLLTMKSARDRTFNSLDLELFCELLAQHLISGRVRLNAPQGFEELTAKTAEEINNRIHALLANFVGDVVAF